jgi:hypothetical protein
MKSAKPSIYVTVPTFMPAACVSSQADMIALHQSAAMDVAP